MKLKMMMVMFVLLAAVSPAVMADGLVAPDSIDRLEAPDAFAPDQEAAPADESSHAPVTEASWPVDIVWVQGGPLPCGPNGCGDNGGGGGGGYGYTCSVTITCPEAQVGPHTIESYQLSCSGYSSCSAYPNASNPSAVVCDGVGTCCFPGNGC